MGALSHLIISVVLAAPLAYAGASKMLEPERFAAVISRFRVPWIPATPTGARVVALVELGAAGMVMLGGQLSAIAGLLYAGLAVVMARAWLRGERGDCGCFGALDSRISAGAVLRNAVLGAGAFAVAWGRGSAILVPFDLRLSFVLAVLLLVGSAATDTLLTVRRST